ncbi:MAG: hypothetical protein A2061_08205 [Gallionellales bacterium GWA2_59_43]|nr:MAG: hypothetical protein A2061_08205 [Gallionellales bacterium GWA2_59_43]
MTEFEDAHKAHLRACAEFCGIAMTLKKLLSADYAALSCKPEKDHVSLRGFHVSAANNNAEYHEDCISPIA